jgi:hypothetical protein
VDRIIRSTQCRHLVLNQSVQATRPNRTPNTHVGLQGKEEGLPLSSQAVRVHDVSQEYWYIKRNPCNCGGQFQKEMQFLTDYDGKPADRLATRCDRCGEARDFIFDISAFHSPNMIVEMMRLEKLLDSVTEEATRAKLLDGMGAPVAKAVGTILDCGRAGDSLALDWLEDAIRHARTLHSAPLTKDDH